MFLPVVFIVNHKVLNPGVSNNIPLTQHSNNTLIMHEKNSYDLKCRRVRPFNFDANLFMPH